MAAPLVRHCRRLLILSLTGVLLLGAAGDGGAAAPRALYGDNFEVSGPGAAADQAWPEIAYNSDGNGYLVVWVDYRDYDEKGQDIYGRILGPTGTPIGSDFRISSSTGPSDESDPAVAYNSTANEYLVVWNDNRDYAGRGWDIRARRVDAAGVPLGAGDFRVATTPGGTKDEWYPDVAFNPWANEYLVVWQDLRNNSWDIYGRRLDWSGGGIGSDRRITPGTDGNAWMPAVAHSSGGNEYLVVWYDYRKSSTRRTDIYGRHLDPGGTPLARDFRISGPQALDYDWSPDVAYNSTANNFLVVWRDRRNGYTRGDDTYGRIVQAAAGPLGGDFRISDPKATEDEDGPRVAWDSSSATFLVAWLDGRAAWEVFARRVYSGGGVYGAAFQVTDDDSTGYTGSYPALAYGSGPNEFLIVWGDNRNIWVSGSNIYGQRVSGG